MGGSRTVLVWGAIVASTLQAASQTASPDWVEWVCSVRAPNAADPDYAFDVALRINDKDFEISLEIPNKSETVRENTKVRYTVVENDAKGINAIAKVRNGPTGRRYGMRILLLNKKDGSFRDGTMVIEGSTTHLFGTCKRK